MSSSLVSGPYASAVSIKFTPSSTARFKTLTALPRSGGQPQIPSPVTRIAPKPSRLTVKSPPNFHVGFVATFDDSDDSAPKITSDPLARSTPPVRSAVPRNVRRAIPVFSFESEHFARIPFSVRPRKLLSTERHCLAARDRWAGNGAGAPTRRRAEPVRPEGGPSPLLRFRSNFFLSRHENGEGLLE